MHNRKREYLWAVYLAANEEFYRLKERTLEAEHRMLTAFREARAADPDFAFHKDPPLRPE